MQQLLPSVLLPSVVTRGDSWLVVVTTLALVLYGVLQERVMTRGWGPQQELFPYSSFLVLSNRLLTVLVLVAHSAAFGHTFIPMAPLRSYCLVSASNMVSTMCQYEALKYVSFVAQTLAKTAKALPVVLWGNLFGGKRYSARQYAHALLITGGCSIFVLGGDITSGSAIRDASWRSYAAGSLLLLTYLAADGWTSTQQEVLFKTHATPIREQLLCTTAFSSLYSLAATLAGGQLTGALSFLSRHPDAAAAVLTLSLASTVIQVCISSVLQRHGALAFSLMMTSRQCASVLLSTLLFGHALSLSQWLGVAIAFSALYHQTTSGSGSSRDSRLARQTSNMRSRLAVSSGPHKQRESDAAQQPLLLPDAMSQGGSAGVLGQSRLAFRGSQAGVSISVHAGGGGGVSRALSLTPFDLAAAGAAGAAVACEPAAAAAAAAAAAGAAARSAGGASPSPALMGNWRAASVHAGGQADPNLVAVAEVQPVLLLQPSPGSTAGQQHVLHRHPAPREGRQQQGQRLPGCAGGVLDDCLAAGMKAQLPLKPHQCTPAALGSSSNSSQAAAAAAVPAAAPGGLSQQQQVAAPGVPAKAVDLRTLWSRGAGRVMVDPTTAVAMDHRNK